MQSVEMAIAESKHLQVSELGSKFNLSFSSYLELGKKIIALDGTKGSLLVMKTNEERNRPYIIDLNEVETVTVKKSYGSIGSGQLMKKRIEEFLKSIDLQFKYRSNGETIALSFFNRETDDLKALPKLERNVKNWQMILSKLIKQQGEGST